MGFILGSILGSFTKALADRSIDNRSYFGRSYCAHCKKELGWYDLFPIISFLLLKGKCRHCHKKIPLDNFINEVLMGSIVAVLFAINAPANYSIFLQPDLDTAIFILSLLFKMFVISVLAIIFWVDLKIGIIPDRITYPAAIISGIYLLLSTGLEVGIFYQNTLQSTFGKYLLPPYSNYFLDVSQRLIVNASGNLISALVGALLFALIIILTRGRGMGWGDVKYVFFLGLALGFPNIIGGIFLAFLTGAVFSIILIVFKRKHFGQTIPFGPFLSLGALIMILWGPQLIKWYLYSFRF